MALSVLEREPTLSLDPLHVAESLDVMDRLPVRSLQLGGVVSGDTTSRRRGPGYEMADVRPYEIGDDVRYIDQKVTARQPDGTIFVREQHRDITPSLIVVTDMLQSRHDKFPGLYSERELALSGVAVMMRWAKSQGMPAKLIGINDDVVMPTSHRPKSLVSKRHILEPLTRLVEATSIVDKDEAPRQVSVTLRDGLNLAARQTTRSVVAVVSDFRYVHDAEDSEQGWAKPLEALAAKHNDIIAVETVHSWDFDLPNEASRFAGITSKLATFGKAGKAYRQLYHDAALEQQAKIDSVLADVSAAHVTLRTDEPQWLTSLHEQLRTAKRR